MVLPPRRRLAQGANDVGYVYLLADELERKARHAQHAVGAGEDRGGAEGHV